MALEIGCGTGELLGALQSLGAKGVGVEPNAAAAQTAVSRYGLTVHVGMLDDVPEAVLSAGTFDLVIMKYALEHVHNPREVLSRIAKLLKPGGKAVFWLPNAASWEMGLFGARWRGLDAPRHLYIFTPTTVQRYAKAVGLQVEKIAFSGVPNDWAGSLSVVLTDRGMAPGVARHFGADSLPALAVLWPVSALAGVLQRAGRIRVTLRKPAI
jgi:SAM-dependent methyltransferase